MMVTLRILLVGLATVLVGCAQRAARIPGHFSGSPDTAYERFLDQVAAEPGAVRTRSGLVYRELTPGRGAAPQVSDTVTVRFQVKTPDGRIVEDSTTHGGAVTVALEQVQPCVREAVLRMRAGGVSRFVCPLPQDDDDRGHQPTTLVPLALETTLVAVGQSLPPPGH